MTSSSSGRLFELTCDLANKGNKNRGNIIKEQVLQPVLESIIPKEVTINLNINLHVHHHDTNTSKIN